MHPILIHYPIALLPLAWFAEVLAALLRREGLRTAGLFMIIVGALGAGGAWWTGTLREAQGEEVLEFAGSMQQVVARHELLATITAVAAGVLALWRLVRCRGMAAKERVLFLVLGFALSVVVLLTGYYGGWITHGVPLLEELGLAGSATQ